MINTKKFDFGQRYMVGHGTGTLATLDTLKEAKEYLATQDDLTRHFCKIYDREKMQYCDGFDFFHGREWRPW